MSSLFSDDPYYTGTVLTDAMVDAAQIRLGVILPAAYLELLAERNGGLLRKPFYPTTFANSWAPDHIGIEAIRGLGGEWGIDDAELGSTAMIGEWGYPPIGVVVCVTPSGGPDAVMLDYSNCGPIGEPSIAYIDEDRVPRTIAPHFAAFLTVLRTQKLG